MHEHLLFFPFAHLRILSIVLWIILSIAGVSMTGCSDKTENDRNTETVLKKPSSKMRSSTISKKEKSSPQPPVSQKGKEEDADKTTSEQKLSSVTTIRQALLKAVHAQDLRPVYSPHLGVTIENTELNDMTEQLCDHHDQSLANVRDWYDGKQSFFYELDDDSPFSCNDKLTHCIDCDEANLRTCHAKSAFTFGEYKGERFLTKITSNPSLDEIPNINSLDDALFGHATESGALCPVRSALTNQEDGFWYVNLTTKQVIAVCGDDEIRHKLSDGLRGGYCTEVCIGRAPNGTSEIHWSGQSTSPDIKAVFAGSEECMGCDLEVPKKLRQAAKQPLPCST